jgi:hypothetical protein
LKVWLDDMRPAPEGWVSCRWPQEVARLVEAGGVRVVSLDHDLGDDERGTGYTFLLWLEEQVALGQLREVPELRIHTANPSARVKMVAAVESIRRLSSAEHS